MKLKIEKQPVAIATIDIGKFKTNLKAGMLPFEALKSAFSSVENQVYQNEDAFFKNLYAETNWGTFFRIVETYPHKRVMTLKVFPCSYEGIPVLQKKIVDNQRMEMEFKDSYEEGEDLIVMAEDTMTDPDTWIDSFIGGRVYNSLTDWEKKIVEIN